MKAFVILCLMASLVFPFGAHAQTRRSGGLVGVPSTSTTSQGKGLQVNRTRSFEQNRPIPQGDFNRPIYNPYFSIYFGPLYEPYEEPCYYDEYYGQWVGPCDAELSSPGFSRTVPNRAPR